MCSNLRDLGGFETTSFDLDPMSRRLLLHIAQLGQPAEKKDAYRYFCALTDSSWELDKWGEKRPLGKILAEESEEFEVDLEIDRQMEYQRTLGELATLGLVEVSSDLVAATDKAKELAIRILEIEYKFVWSQYLRLERKLQDFLSLVPPHAPNFQVWSPELGHLLVGACNILNSLFKATARHAEFVTRQDLKRLWEKPDPEYADFQQLYEPVYRLSEKVVYVLPVESFAILGGKLPVVEPKPIRPFQEWKPNNSPDWWKCHNKLKHDWLNYVRKATLQTTISGFAGAFLVFVLCTATRRVLIDEKIVRLPGNFSTSFIKQQVGGLEPLTAQYGLAGKSMLFGYIFDSEPEKPPFPVEVFGPDSTYWE